MTIQDLIKRSYRLYRGKGPSKTPLWASEKSDVALDIANQKVEEWATDSKRRWNSLFQIKDVDTIDTSVLTYALDEDFMFPSDFIVLEKTNGETAEVELTKPQRRIGNETKAYISGNPKSVTFSSIDAGFDGGTLKAPGYYKPAVMDSAEDVVSVDDPNWLAHVVAAELAANDPAHEDRVPMLLGQANELYIKMIEANELPRGNTIPYEMPTINEDEDF